MKPNVEFMQLAIEEAILAKQRGGYGIGAVIVRDGEVIAKGANRFKEDMDATQHAEMVVMRDAFKALGEPLLHGCVLYTTLEPCSMCASAVLWAEMEGVVFGASISDSPWDEVDITNKEIFERSGKRIDVVEGFMRDECIRALGE